MDLNSILSKVIRKVDENSKLNKFPHNTENGKWVTTNDGYWTGGFWTSLLWLLYKNIGNERYKKEERMKA